MHRVLSLYCVALSVTVAGCADLLLSRDSHTDHYVLSEWLYVLEGDTILLTEESYFWLDLTDSDQVRGQGLMVLQLFLPTPDGPPREVLFPIYGEVGVDGQIGPRLAEGWYWNEAGTIRFSLKHRRGQGTFLEGFGWQREGGLLLFQTEEDDAKLFIMFRRR